MSNDAINWAVSQEIKPSSTKFVLIMYANCADDRFLAWPSAAYLEMATGQDRKTVLESIKRLRERGYMEDTGERKGSTKQVIVYRLNCPENGTVKPSQKRNSTENGTVPNFQPNSPVFPVEQSQISLETVPKTGHGTIIEPSMNPQEAKGECKSPKEAAEILAHLNAQAQRNYRPVKANISLITARLKEGATVDECKAVVDLKTCQWLNDQKMSAYLRPATLFNATNFAQYVGELSTGGQEIPIWERT